MLAELTDAAVNYIKKEEYEKALLLLQKSHGILEIVGISSKDQLQNYKDTCYSYVTFQNMALCY
mgnify:CR=1 FL=1